MHSKEEIVRVRDKADGFWSRHIFGLNLFPDSYDEWKDPRLLFLRGLFESQKVTALTGNLQDIATSPEELLRDTPYLHRCDEVRIGIHDANFYDSAEWLTFPPLFFPGLSEDFADISKPGCREENLLFTILYYDALSLFIHPRTETSVGDLKTLLMGELGSIENLLKSGLELFGLVLMSSADGDYFVVNASDPEMFSLLDQPLVNAVDFIRESDWFRQNRDELVWDEEYSMCLVPRS